MPDLDIIGENSGSLSLTAADIRSMTDWPDQLIIDYLNLVEMMNRITQAINNDFGTMALQNADAVAITGGTISGVTLDDIFIGDVTATNITTVNLTATGTVNLHDVTITGYTHTAGLTDDATAVQVTITDSGTSVINFASTGNTTIGNAAADSLTTNYGIQTIASNIVSTRAMGAVAAGVVNEYLKTVTFTSDAGGTSDLRSFINVVVFSGANALFDLRNHFLSSQHAGSNLITTINGLVVTNSLTSTGNVTSARGVNSGISLTSSGSITGQADSFIAVAPILSSTGTIATINGLRVQDQGHATLVTNAFGVSVDSFTAAVTLTASFRSLQIASTGAWGFYHSGTANNAFAGNVRIGSVVVPTATLDVTGTLIVSSTSTLQGTNVARLNVTGATIVPNGLYLPSANTLGFAINTAAELQLTDTAFSPAVDGGNSLGTTALGWADLFLATGGTVHFANTDWVATHTTGILTVGTGDLRVTTAGGNAASVITSAGVQAITGKTQIQVDNITIDLNTISTTSGNLNLTPVAGSAIVLDGTISVDAGVVTGATSITTNDLIVNDSTTLGATSADTLTINAGTWVFPNDTIITRTSGVLAAGTTYADETTNTFSGDAGGTSDRRGRIFTLNATGTQNIAQQITQYMNSRNNLTSGTIAVATAYHGNVYNLGAGVTTFAIVFEGHVRVDGTGGIGEARIFNVASSVLNGTGRVPTIIGYRSSGGLGHATLVDTAKHFFAPDTSATTLVVGFDTAISSGIGKWAFRSTDTANSALAGNVRIGSTTAPTVALDVTGAALISTTLGVTGVLTLTPAISMLSTGTGPTVGELTMVIGTKLVSTTAATSTCKIFFQRKTAGGTIGFATTYTINAGVSFTVSSDSALDTSTYVWWIVEAR